MKTLYNISKIMFKWFTSVLSISWSATNNHLLALRSPVKWSQSRSLNDTPSSRNFSNRRDVTWRDLENVSTSCKRLSENSITNFSVKMRKWGTVASPTTRSNDRLRSIKIVWLFFFLSLLISQGHWIKTYC